MIESKVRGLTPEGFRRNIQRELGCINEDPGLELCLAAEKIRVTVAIAMGYCVNVLHITNQVRDSVASLVEEQTGGSEGENKFAIRTLNLLTNIGDVRKVGDKYVATPLRLINVSSKSEYALLVGSTPTQVLEQLLQTRVHCYGVARFVKRSSLARDIRSDERRWQSFKDWVGSPEPDLEAWAEHTIAAAIERADTGAPIDATNIEVYRPTQPKRWALFDVVRRLSPGPYLFRAVIPGYVRKRYFVGTIRSEAGGMTVSRSYLVKPRIGERLIYGIDCLNEAPYTFTLRLHGCDLLELVYPRPVPFPEKKVLLLGVRVGNEAIYKYPEQFSDLLKAGLSVLGAQTVTEDGEHK